MARHPLSSGTRARTIYSPAAPKIREDTESLGSLCRLCWLFIFLYTDDQRSALVCRVEQEGRRAECVSVREAEDARQQKLVSGKNLSGQNNSSVFQLFRRGSGRFSPEGK